MTCFNALGTYLKQGFGWVLNQTRTLTKEKDKKCQVNRFLKNFHKNHKNHFAFV